MKSKYFIIVKILLIFFYTSCKIESKMPSPSRGLGIIVNDVDNSETIEEQARVIQYALVMSLRDKNIRDLLFVECSKGIEEYFWVDFETLKQKLFESNEIDFYNKMNDYISTQYSLPNNIDYMSRFIEQAREAGFSPHIAIPNLNKLINKELSADRTLELQVEDIMEFKNPNIGVYFEADRNRHGFNYLQYEGNGIVSKFIPNSLLCDELVVFLAYRIIDPNEVNPCVYGNSQTLVYNCVLREPYCKICEEVMPHNESIGLSPETAIGNAEILLKLLNNNTNPEIIEDNFPCHNVAYSEPGLSNDFNSFGFLSSISSFDYYHPINSIQGGGYINNDLEITQKPINYKQYSGFTSSFVEATKVSLCTEDNYFHVKGDQSGKNELAGGVYRISRLNGIPYYFVFPGHILGSLMFHSGADNIIHYDLIGRDPRIDLCTPNSEGVQATALTEGLTNWESCKFCTPNENSLNLNNEYFVNTDKNFLLDYWYGDALTVGISYQVDNFKTPENNVINFESDLDGINNCDLSIINKTLVATLRKSGNIINQFKYFNQFYPPSTKFYIEVDMLFSSGKAISNCGVITTESNGSTLLKGVGIIPRGNVSQMEIKVYKMD